MGGGENEDRMGPDGKAGEDAPVSSSVCTVHAIEPCCDGPIVSPLRVIVAAAALVMDDEPVSVSTMEVAVGAAQVAVLDVPLIVLIAAVGVADVAKKPGG